MKLTSLSIPKLTILVLIIILSFVYYKPSFLLDFWPSDIVCAPVRNPPEKNVEILKSELQSNSKCLRAAAAFDIQKVGIDGFSALEILLKTANDKYPEVRWRSLAAIGHIIGDKVDDLPEEQVKRIEELAFSKLDDPINHIQKNAIFTLGHIKTRRTAERLVGIMHTSDMNLLSYASAHFQYSAQYPRDEDLIWEVINILEPLQKTKVAEEESNIYLSYYTLKNFLKYESKDEARASTDFLDPLNIEVIDAQTYLNEFKSINFDWLFEGGR